MELPPRQNSGADFYAAAQSSNSFGEVSMFWLRFRERSLGDIYLVASNTALLQISIGKPPAVVEGGEVKRVREGHPVLSYCRRQLQEYCRGQRVYFQLPYALDLVAQEFSRRVLLETTRIPYGTTQTYGGLALAAGKPHAARAVGQIMHLNPLPILIPCHRVVGKNQQLVGYAGGVEMKAYLLHLEGAIL